MGLAGATSTVANVLVVVKYLEELLQSISLLRRQLSVVWVDSGGPDNDDDKQGNDDDDECGSDNGDGGNGGDERTMGNFDLMSATALLSGADD